MTRRNTKQCHDRRDERDRSRHGHRPGYTLEDGSGCLTIGVHLRGPVAEPWGEAAVKVGRYPVRGELPNCLCRGRV